MTGAGSVTYVAHDERDTARLGAALAAALPEPAVVALDGPLGAGKTRLAQAIASALAIDPRDVTSPTFVLVQQYQGQRVLNHFDAYRVKDEAEFWELGPQEYYDRGITLIEWAGRVAGCLPAERLHIAIEVLGPSSRRFELTAVGAAYQAVIGQLASSW